MPAGLSIIKRQRSSNAHILTFSSHRSDFNFVLSNLPRSLEALDRDSILKINEEKQTVWAPVLAFFGNIKQQQALGSFWSLSKLLLLVL